MTSRPSLGAAAAIVAVTLWSTNAYTAGIALERLTVLQLLALQYGSAALALIATKAVLGARRRTTSNTISPTTSPATTSAAAASEVPGSGLSGRWGRRRTRWAPLLVGVFGLTATIFLQYLAFDTAPLIGANVICYADGLIAAIWVAAWRPSRHTLLGVPLALLGFAGVLVVLTEGGGLDTVALGYLFALGAAVGMAFYSLASGRLSASTFDVLIPATVVGTVIALVVSVARGEAWPEPGAWVSAIYIGLGPMAAGYALWTFAMSDGRADRLIPLSYATPLLSTGLLLATGQPFTAQTLIGAALILLCSTGVLLNQWLYTRHHATSTTPTTSPPSPSSPPGQSSPSSPSDPGPGVHAASAGLAPHHHQGDTP